MAYLKKKKKKKRKKRTYGTPFLGVIRISIYKELKKHIYV